MPENSSPNNKKDYFITTFIALCVSFFLIPILRNITKDQANLSFLNPESQQKVTSLSLINWILFALILTIALSLLFAIILLVAKKIALKIPLILQLTKFVFVGGFNTMLDWSVINLLIFATGISTGWQFSIFKALSFLIANVVSYFWNKKWIFQSEKKNTTAFGQFFAVSLIGLLVNVGVASLIVNVIKPLGGISPILWAQIGLFLSTAISMIWNFVGYKLIVFKK